MKRLFSTGLIVCAALISLQSSNAFGFRGRGCRNSCAPIYCCETWTSIDCGCGTTGGGEILPGEILPGEIRPEEIRPNTRRVTPTQLPTPTTPSTRVLPTSLSQTTREWTYIGDRPKMLIGTVSSISAGEVTLVSHRGGAVNVPIQNLGLSKQKLVAQHLAAVNRLWTDARGLQRQAKFVRMDGQSVVLKTTAGRMLTVSVSQLSAADQCVVQHTSETVLPETLPAPRREHFVTH